jgi:CheY-like chemotaxis protein
MVYSEVGHGTAFKIYFPAVDEMVQKKKWPGGGDAASFAGTETILLVEDEDLVRSLVREILTGNGYKVLEAASGKEALEICAVYTDTIHLLLTDVIMPKMGGSELRDHVVSIFPDIKVLFMSGYTDDSVALQGILESDVEYIEKPFTPDNLSKKVREALL